MKKITLAIIICYLILVSFIANAQTDQNIKENNCLFGYVSDNPDEYNQVIEYLSQIGVKVISSCEDELIIYVTLNRRYKDYTYLFSQIEKRFRGTCYYKSQDNKIPLYNKCSEQYIKDELSNK